ncbi:MAG: Gfo/Idh/MocA family oxidoreductase [Gemmatimonadetes bacterium]|nr:Gfo/Idh/MocA family oxidoreductase [Gemmatimonadota bacterium]
MTARPYPVRVAVVGAGAISQVMHVPILAEHPGAELCVLADVDAHKARTVAARFSVPEVLDPTRVLAREDVDAVVLCTPYHLHEEQAGAALEAGKHVFVERPAALTSVGARRVVEAARSSGKKLVVGLPHRFRPEASALRSWVEGGQFGRLGSVRGIWLNRKTPVVRSTWRHDRTRAGGGVLMDLGLPTLDLCLWLVGYPEMRRVSCTTFPGEHEVEEGAIVMAESREGLTVTLEVSSRYFAGHDHYHARVMGTEGSGSLPPLEIYKQRDGRPVEVTPRQPRPRGDENPYTNAYRRQLDHFVRVLSGQAEAPLPEEQVPLMRLLEAAYESAATRREVELSGT